MADRAPPFLSDAPALTRLLSSGLQFSLIMGFENSRVGDPFGSFCAQIALCRLLQQILATSRRQGLLACLRHGDEYKIEVT
jgi:hypothetical protein